MRFLSTFRTFSYQPYENRAKNWVNWLFFNYCTSHYTNIIDWQNLTIPWLIGPEGNFLLFFEKNFMSSFFKAFPLRVSRNRIATPPLRVMIEATWLSTDNCPLWHVHLNPNWPFGPRLRPFWPLATSNYGGLRQRIGSLWPHESCGLRPQGTIAASGRKSLPSFWPRVQKRLLLWAPCHHQGSRVTSIPGQPYC